MGPTPFYKGGPLYASQLNELADEIRKNTIQPGSGYLINRTSGGTTLVIQDQNGGSGGSGGTAESLEQYPFKVNYFVFEEGYYINVDPHSFLWKSPAADTQTIANLESNFAFPSLGEMVVLKITLDSNYRPNGAYFIVGAYQSFWEGYPDPIERDPENGRQGVLYVPIAEISSADDSRSGTVVGDKKIINLTRTDLCLFLTAIGGQAAVVAAPWISHNEIQ